MTSRKEKRAISDSLAEELLAWITKRHPEYVHFTSESEKTPAYRLENALRGMCWRLTDWTKIDKKPHDEYSKMLRAVTKDWNPELSTEVKAYLISGGYEAAELEAAKFFAEEEAKEAKEAKAVKVEVKEVEAELEKEIENLEPRAQLSPEHELEEIVAEAARALNPHYKAW